ncbi:MAG TPA: sulfatase [Verrucomicrobiales bacterium]|nr:sulfatase [Verrucomicrobiales bacterium]
MKEIARIWLAAALTASVLSTSAADRPNILWITSEDNGPHLGCYGDEYAVSPNIDALAARGMRYLRAWSTAPVCAPARTTIISGLYATSTGAQHMRSETRLPDFMKMFPEYLREEGYYCTNNSKEDYNLKKTGKVWDESSNRAHWKNRQPGQPFFAVFNHTISHESQIRNQINERDRIHDPAKVRVPAYHPDTPEVRKDWAQYHDRITMMDRLVGGNLKELAEAGLAEDTIVFYYGDHGSGMPRNKRWPYNSGLQVPLIVHFPPKWAHLAPRDYADGGTTSRLVGFVDLAPTALSIAGIKPPAWMQGHAFAGRFEARAQPYLFGFRGRMDERYDMVRSVTDGRHVYIRNYMPHKIYGQHIDYMFQTPTTRVWKQLFDEGRLDGAQSRFWQTKPAEELYDLESDPDEVNNLAGSQDHQQILRRLRRAQQKLAEEIRDLGFLPENEIHGRDSGSAPYTMGHDRKLYPVNRIMKIAEKAASLDPKETRNLLLALDDDDSAVRYWAAMGLLMRGQPTVEAHRRPLLSMLNDPAPAPRIAAAEALGRYGNDDDAATALRTLLELAPMNRTDIYVSMLALNAIDAMGDRAKAAAKEIAEMPVTRPGLPGKLNGYVPRLLEDMQAKWE